MTTPYGGNDPQQWGQPGSGGWPAQGQPEQQQWGQPGGGYPGSGPLPQQQPGQDQWGQQQWGQPPSGPQPQQPQYEQPQQTPWQQPEQQQWQQPEQQQWQQPGGYPGYGQYPPPAPPEGKKKSKAWLWITLAVVVLAAAAVAILGFVAPGFFVNKTLDGTAVEKGVVEILGKDAKVENVSCPDGEPVEAGHKFSCKATINGQQMTVPITVKNDDAQYEVGQPK